MQKLIEKIRPLYRKLLFWRWWWIYRLRSHEAPRQQKKRASSNAQLRAEISELRGLYGRSIPALAELLSDAMARPARDHAWRKGAPLISVIMPTHHRPEALLRAIESVVAQSYGNWELLVINDDHNPETEKILLRLSGGDARIRHFALPWSGAAHARNRGIAESRGQVLTYLDDDNTWYPQYLETVAQTYVDHPDTELTYAAQLWIGDQDQIMLTYDCFDWQALFEQRMSIDMNVLSHSRALHDTLGGFDERLLRFQDWDLVLRYTADRTPRRIPVLATRYDWGSTTRISNQRPYIASQQMIRDKHAKPIATPLRVLFVCFDYPQLSESYVHTEIRWLLSHGVHIEVHCGELPRSPGQPLAPIHYGNLADTIAAVAPDIVHVHWMSQTSQFAETLARCGVPVTVRVHGFDYTDQLGRELARMPWLQRLYTFPGLQPGDRRDAEKWLPLASNFDSTRYYPPKSKNRRLVLRCGACLPTKDLQLTLQVAALRPEYRFLLVLSNNNHGIELAETLIRKNEELGSPAEIRFDLQYDEMAALMREASVYLHTFGYAQPFGQPISIAEAMACGTIPCVRFSRRALDYTGEAGLYYDSAADVSELLAEMLAWDDARWARQTDLCVERAFTRHADCVVLPDMLNDWINLAGQTRIDVPATPS